VSLQTNRDTDLRIVTGGADDIDIENGVLFVRFAEAIVTGTVPEVAATRDALDRRLGNDAVVDAAAVAALFNAINRVADAIGIQFEASKLDRTADLRAQLELDRMATARLPD
jgi:hypothetical protein